MSDALPQWKVHYRIGAGRAAVESARFVRARSEREAGRLAKRELRASYPWTLPALKVVCVLPWPAAREAI